MAGLWAQMHWQALDALLRIVPKIHLSTQTKKSLSSTFRSCSTSSSHATMEEIFRGCSTGGRGAPLYQRRWGGGGFQPPPIPRWIHPFPLYTHLPIFHTHPTISPPICTSSLLRPPLLFPPLLLSSAGPLSIWMPPRQSSLRQATPSLSCPSSLTRCSEARWWSEEFGDSLEPHASSSSKEYKDPPSHRISYSQRIPTKPPNNEDSSCHKKNRLFF
jgi:hypothetical protein